MSTKGIYTALSGAMAQSQRLDTIANNLANVNTSGFKKDHQVFREYLTANEKMPNVIQVPKIPASIESFYDMQGGDKSYLDSAGTYTDFTQGGLKKTGNSLDLALDGSGFFEVLTPQGVRWTRNGSFNIDGYGQIVTKDGYPVLALAPEGTDTEARILQVKSADVQIDENGEVFDGDQLIGRIAVVDTQNKDHLRKIGNSLYTLNNNPTLNNQLNSQVINQENNPPNSLMTPVHQAKIKNGFLESSNVDVVKEMTDMIATTRTFESTQKAISAYDAMADKLVNVVPKTTG